MQYFKPEDLVYVASRPRKRHLPHKPHLVGQVALVERVEFHSIPHLELTSPWYFIRTIDGEDHVAEHVCLRPYEPPKSLRALREWIRRLRIWGCCA